jgi:RNA polymerase sigma factor (sigma-70 family)
MDEQEAVRRLKKGDSRGLECLVLAHQVRAIRTAYLITGDRGLAEEVVQEAFLRAYRSIGTFDPKRPFEPWFLRSVVNAAVRLARRSGARFVIADVGPTGEYLPPIGKGDPESWRIAFERQGRALWRTGADALHIETMCDAREAAIALESLQRTAPGLPVLVSLAFERKKRGFFTIMGNPLSASLRALAEAGADAVGANCTLASADMRLLAEEARGAVDLPLVLQPNAGSPQRRDGSVFYAQDPEAFADEMAIVASLGVELVGGCCGTDPRFIRALRRLLPPKGERL